MGKKILCLLAVGLLFTLIMPLGYCSPLNSEGTTHADYKSKLFVIGVIQIDSFAYEIRGFAIYAINDGEVLILQNINIKYDGATPIQVSGVIPLFVHHIRYNPVE